MLFAENIIIKKTLPTISNTMNRKQFMSIMLNICCLAVAAEAAAAIAVYDAVLERKREL